MIVAIIGNGEDKFTPETAEAAKQIIRTILKGATVMVSGHSPLGGVDIWAEEVAAEYSLPTDIKAPRDQRWDGEYGYKQRNLDIARSADIVHVIVAKTYPPDYQGRRFKLCYHCKRDDHIKSGACYTAKKAMQMGKPAVWHIVGDG